MIALPADAECDAQRAFACASLLQLGLRVGLADENPDELFEEGKALASRSNSSELLVLLAGSYGIYRGVCLGEADVYRTHGMSAANLSDLTTNTGLQVVARIFHQYGALFSGRFKESIAVGTEMIHRCNGNPEIGQNLIHSNPLASIHCGVALALLPLGELAAAERSAVELGHISRKAGWSEGIIEEAILASQFAAWRGNSLAQIQHAQRAVEISERSGGLFMQVFSYLTLGIAHLNGDHAERAIECLQVAARINDQTGAGRAWHGGVHGRLAAALIKLGQVDEAHRVARDAVEFCRPRILRHDLQPWFSLARAQILKGDAEAMRMTLDETQCLINTTEARYYQPFLHELRADYAKAFATNWSPDDELREAHRLFSELGMAGQVARLDSLDE